MEKELELKRRLAEIRLILNEMLPFIPGPIQEDMRKALRLTNITETPTGTAGLGKLVE